MKQQWNRKGVRNLRMSFFVLGVKFSKYEINVYKRISYVIKINMIFVQKGIYGFSLIIVDFNRII